MRWLLSWILSAISLIIVAHFVPGIYISGFFAALIAAVVFGLINSTLGLFLKFISFPLIIITLGLFWFVINALMFKLASMFVPGFDVRGFMPAFLGSVLLSVVNMVLHWLILPKRRRSED
jgi:putative membrane protein